MSQFEEYINEKFKSYTSIPNQWDIHEYILGGMSYGFILYKRKDKFELKTLVDSGYNTGIVVETDEQRLWQILECFAPTNPNYNTYND